MKMVSWHSGNRRNRAGLCERLLHAEDTHPDVCMDPATVLVIFRTHGKETHRRRMCAECARTETRLVTLQAPRYGYAAETTE